MLVYGEASLKKWSFLFGLVYRSMSLHGIPRARWTAIGRGRLWMGWRIQSQNSMIRLVYIPAVCECLCCPPRELGYLSPSIDSPERQLQCF